MSLLTQINLHADKAVAAAAKVLPGEHVVTASVGSWTGQWGAMAALQAVPIVGMYLRSKGKRASGGLPQRFIVALTDERLVILNQPKAQLKGWEIVAKDENRSFPRAGLQAEFVPGPAGTTMRVRPAAGDPFEIVVIDELAAKAMAAELR